MLSFGHWLLDTPVLSLASLIEDEPHPEAGASLEKILGWAYSLSILHPGPGNGVQATLACYPGMGSKLSVGGWLVEGEFPLRDRPGTGAEGTV